MPRVPTRAGRAKRPRKDGSGPPQATESRILAAAEQIFAEKGLKGARVKEIAALAHVPPSLINYHYGGKENLYRIVIENYYVTMERRLFPIFAQEGLSPQEKLKRVLCAAVELLAEKDSAARILLRESIDKGKYVNELLSRPYLREMFQMAERFLFSNLKPGRRSPNELIHILSNLLGCLTMFFIASSTIRELWKKDVYSRTLIEERKREVVDFVFNGIAGRFR